MPELQFRTHLTHNFQDVVNFTESNVEKIKELEVFYRKLAQSESRYALETAKLYSQYQNIFLAANQHEKSFSRSWSNCCEEGARVASGHQLFSNALSDTLANKLHAGLESYSSLRKILTETGNKRKKELEDAYTTLKKSKLTYEASRREFRELNAQLQQAQNNYLMAGKTQKLQAKVEGGRNKKKQLKAILNEHEQYSTKLQNEYYHEELPNLLDNFEMLEIWRISWLKDIVLETNIKSMELVDTFAKAFSSLSEKIQNVSIEDDLECFVSSLVKKDMGYDISVMSLINPDCAGRLDMTSKVLGGTRWKEYHCVLTWKEKKLYLFESEDSKNAKQICNLMEGPRVIRPVDVSLLSRNFAFQIKTENGPLFFACPTEDSYHKWIESFQDTSDYSVDIYQSSERCVKSLKVVVSEAKGLPVGNYFVLLCLDSEYQAKTMTVTNTDHPIWSEEFEFDALQKGFENLVVFIMSADKQIVTQRLNEEKIGYVLLTIMRMPDNTACEDWFPVKSLVYVQATDSDPPTLRLKYTFSNEAILPLYHYLDLAHATWNLDVFACLDAVIKQKEREKNARTLISIYRAWGKAPDFLKEFSSFEVNNTANEKQIFRSNSLVTKCLDQWMKMVGMDFLHRALQTFCEDVYSQRNSCEVDPSRANPQEIRANFRRLVEVTEKAWNSIRHALKQPLPWEMRTIFKNLQNLAIHRWGDDNIAQYTTISGIFFLRFICPALINPRVFNIMPTSPPPNTARTLTLVAKTLQNLANLVEFGKKEPYMEDMNQFIRNNKEEMKYLINNNCKIYAEDEPEQLPRIDLPRKMARLHSHLVENANAIEEYHSKKPTEGVRELIASLNDLEKPLVDRRQIQRDDSKLPNIFQSSTPPQQVSEIKFDFRAEGPGELTVNAGDRVLILNAHVEGAEGWVSVKHGNNSGFVPRSFINIFNPERADVDSNQFEAQNEIPMTRKFTKIPLDNSFYYSDMERTDSAEVLKQANDGSFVVRKSNRRTHDYTIALKFQGVVKNFGVKILEDSKYMIIGKDDTFTTFYGLLKNYQTEALTEKGELLIRQL